MASLSNAIKALFGFKTTYRINPLVDEVENTVTKILDISDNRVGFVITNLSGNAMYIAPDNQVAATRGIYLAANGGSASLVWDRDFEMCSQEWYGIAAAANSDVFLMEYIVSG